MGARNQRLVQLGALAGILALAVAVGIFWDGGDGDEAPPRQVAALPTATATPSGTVAEASPTVAPPATPAPASPGLAAARSLYREGRYGDARTAFQLLAAAPVSPEERANALVGAATSAFDLNDEAAGFAALEDAVRTAPPGSGPAVTARYLLVKRLNDVGRGSEAAALFAEAPDLASNSPVEPYYELEGGRAKWAQGGREIWESLLASNTTSAALKTRIREENVSRWRATGDSGGLLRALDALIQDSGDPEARFERAQLAAAAGDGATFAEQLRAIVLGSPGSRFAGLALDELEAAGFGVDPGAAGVSYYRRGLYTRAKAVLLPSLDTAQSANDLAFRAYYLAAAYEDSGEAANAIHYYDMAANSGASSDYVHRAMYWAARVTESIGSAPSASARYVALASGPSGEFTQEAAFRAGYVLYEAGNTSGALGVWEGSPAPSARLEYWRGQALRESGDSAGAVAAFERAVELGPLDLHGMEASRELGRQSAFDVRYRARDLDQPIDWVAIASWLSTRISGGPSGSPPTAACELMAAGLRSAAAAEIRAADALGGTWRSFELMREARECGLTDLAARMAVAIRIEAGVASHEPPKDLLRVSYPIDFNSTVAAEAEKAGVDPLFFASLIRQESFWDPSALSIADARGLTQVIPPTGEAIAGELGVAEFRISDLYRPALSLEFGAYYLGGQVRAYGDALVALSAYNAGPGNARRWSLAGASTPAELVEVIDFVETRTYVTYIYEAYAHYQRAWSE